MEWLDNIISSGKIVGTLPIIITVILALIIVVVYMYGYETLVGFWNDFKERKAS